MQKVILTTIQVNDLIIYYQNTISKCNIDYNKYCYMIKEIKEQEYCKLNNKSYFGDMHYLTINEIQKLIKDIKIHQYNTYLRYIDMLKLLNEQNLYTCINRIELININNVSVDTVQNELLHLEY